MTAAARLTIQQWGNSFAVRMPSAVASAAHVTVGQPVEVTVEASGVVVRAVGAPKLSHAQKLALFESAFHGGEVMTSGPVGAEIF